MPAPKVSDRRPTRSRARSRRAESARRPTPAGRAARALAPSIPILLLALAPSATGQPSLTEGEQLLAEQPAELVERLQRDRFVLLDELGEDGEADGAMIHGLVIFARPRNDVLRLLIQTARRTEYQPELREARIVEERGNAHVVAFRMRMMLMTIEYRAVHAWDLARGEVWWQLDPTADNDFAHLEGRWKVYVLDDRSSLARFGTRIDVGPSLPRFLQDLATRQKLPETLDNVRRWVDSGGTYRP